MNRKLDVTTLTLKEATYYFFDQGVGTDGIRTQAELNEALNDHRHNFPISRRLSDDIERYLRANGYGRADVKATYANTVKSRKMMYGNPKTSRWLVLRLKIQNLWQKRR